MGSSMLLGVFDWIVDFFKELFALIPQIIYLLYASLACLMDAMQLLFRKLAGLDVYYVDGKPVSGDIIYGFITGILGINSEGAQYPMLSTIFWAFIVFGIIMVFITTLVAIVKSHYSYDDKSAKGPMQYIYTAGKAIINMVAVPIIVVLGLYLNQAILTAVDSITSVSTGTVEDLYGSKASQYLQKVQTSRSMAEDSKDYTYIFYDIFGFGSSIVYGDSGDDLIPNPKELALVGSTNQTFSGALFKVGAYNANRARNHNWAASGARFSGWDTLFSEHGGNNEVLAEMIDTAFACHLHVKTTWDFSFANAGDSDNGLIAKARYLTTFLMTKINAFSKFNVGAVWYYYDLWQFNFIVAFAGLIVSISIFVNIVFGLISRLFTVIILFLVAPPLFGLAPLDGGAAGKKWQSNFMKQVLMTYGAVVGMNLMLMLLPYLNTIKFFNIMICDLLMQTLIIMAGLITIKAIIALISDLVGAADANATGEKLAAETGALAVKTGHLMEKAGTVGAAAGGMARSAMKTGVNAAGTAWSKARKNANERKYNKAGDEINRKNSAAYKSSRKDFIDELMKPGNANASAKDIKNLGKAYGLSASEAKNISKTVKEERKKGGSSADIANRALRKQAARDKVGNAALLKKQNKALNRYAANDAKADRRWKATKAAAIQTVDKAGEVGAASFDLVKSTGGEMAKGDAFTKNITDDMKAAKEKKEAKEAAAQAARQAKDISNIARIMRDPSAASAIAAEEAAAAAQAAADKDAARLSNRIKSGAGKVKTGAQTAVSATKAGASAVGNVAKKAGHKVKSAVKGATRRVRRP